MLFRCSGILLLGLYLALPFGNQLTQLLHQATHQVASIVTGPDVDIHAHKHHHGDTPHAHQHLQADVQTSKTFDGDHAHPLLDFLSDFADFAKGTDDNQITFKSVDKHLGNAQFFINERTPVQHPSTFPALTASTLSEHAFVVPKPPDAAFLPAQS